MIAMTTRRLCDLTEGDERDGLDRDLYFNLMILDLFLFLLYLNVFVRQVSCPIHQDGNHIFFVVQIYLLHNNSKMNLKIKKKKEWKW